MSIARSLIITLCGFMVSGQSVSADPPCYEVTAIVPGPYCGPILGYSPMFARGLSNHDSPWIAGFYAECGGGFGSDQAYVWQGTGPVVPLTYPPGINSAYGFDVTDNGWLIGTFWDVPRGFIYDSANGQWTQLESAVPGGGVDARAGNRAGMVVGARNFISTAYSAFIFHNGQYTDLGVMNGPFSFAMDINESGAVTGWTGSGQAQNGNRAFLHVDGKTTILPVHPNGNQAEGWKINNKGDVIGWTTISQASNSARAALWHDGLIVTLDPVSGYNSCVARSVNDQLLIVGSCGVPTDKFSTPVVPWLWKDNEIFNLNTLLIPPSEGYLQLDRAYSINNRGQILCEGHHSTWRENFGLVAVILTPIDLQGDVDLNCHVNIQDILEVVGAWGVSGGGTPADINKDDIVNIADLLIVIVNWTDFDGNQALSLLQRFMEGRLA